ncbi:MAG: metallophosphoesterase [Oscillospiraceae bacterium]|nr:metallophosphoesterase [Oscillospiraceae bacterium]
MNNTLRFHLVTDTHHYATCFEYDFEKNRGDQQCRAETGAIIDAAFDLIANDKDADIVLISGDLTCNGEQESHLEFIEKLRRLKAAGKRVYLITATHDYNDSPTPVIKGSGKKASPTSRAELPGMYAEFGRSEALSVHEESFCYSVRLMEGYRLLCLNDDGNGRSRCGYDEDTMRWILGQIEEAKQAGDYIFAMTHHPVLPPTPIYPLFSKRDMLGDYEETSEILADAGLEFIFTGHSHMQNIAVKQTAKGNRIYDINTSSLVGCPTAIRKVALDGEKMAVETLQIQDFDWDRGGKTVNEYLQDKFDYLLKEIFYSMAHDLDRFAELAVGFSVDKKTVQKLKVPLKIGGKVLQRLTVGGLGRLIFASGKIDRSIKKVKVKDLIIDVIRNLYMGDEPHAPGTPVHKAFSALVSRITPVIRRTKKPDDILAILNLVKDGVLYDAPPSDWNAVLPRREGRQE